MRDKLKVILRDVYAISKIEMRAKIKGPKKEANLAEKSFFQKFITLELLGAKSSYFGNLHYLWLRFWEKNMKKIAVGRATNFLNIGWFGVEWPGWPLVYKPVNMMSVWLCVYIPENMMSVAVCVPTGECDVWVAVRYMPTWIWGWPPVYKPVNMWMTTCL